MVADGARFTTRFAGLLAILARLESWIKAATVVKEFRGPPGTPVLLTTTQAAPIPSPHVAVFACTAAGLQTPAQTLQCAFTGLHQPFRVSPPFLLYPRFLYLRPRGLDDGRPLCQLRLDELRRFGRCHARRRIDTGLLQAMENGRIGQRLGHGRTERVDNRLRRLCRCEQRSPGVALEPSQALL